MIFIKKVFAFSIFFGIIHIGNEEGLLMAKVGNRQNKTLVCTECNEENYRVSKNVKNTTDRLEIKKYCSRCQKHTTHKEKK